MTAKVSQASTITHFYGLWQIKHMVFEYFSEDFTWPISYYVIEMIAHVVYCGQS